MLYVIGKDKHIQEVIEPASLPSLGVLERQHFEEWVCAYPAMLGEELLIVTSEYSRFDRTSERLDVMAVDRQGKLAVVELKREDAGGAPELQAVRYAAYCSNMTLEDVSDLRAEFLRSKGEDSSEEAALEEITDFIRSEDFEDFDSAPRIIIASGGFREDTLASVLWLRNMGLDITCIRIEAFALGDDIAIRPTVIIPLPEAKDYVVSTERKKVDRGLTAREREYLEFYTRMLGAFRERFPDATKRQPSKRSWMGLPSGYGGIGYYWSFHGTPRDSFAVELHFERATYDENKELIDYIEAHQKTLQEQIGVALNFQHHWGQRWSRIHVQNEDGDTGTANFEWGLEMMTMFIRAMQPLLDEYHSQ